MCLVKLLKNYDSVFDLEQKIVQSFFFPPKEFEFSSCHINQSGLYLLSTNQIGDSCIESVAIESFGVVRKVMFPTSRVTFYQGLSNNRVLAIVNQNNLVLFSYGKMAAEIPFPVLLS